MAESLAAKRARLADKHGEGHYTVAGSKRRVFVEVTFHPKIQKWAYNCDAADAPVKRSRRKLTSEEESQLRTWL